MVRALGLKSGDPESLSKDQLDLLIPGIVSVSTPWLAAFDQQTGLLLASWDS